MARVESRGDNRASNADDFLPAVAGLIILVFDHRTVGAGDLRQAVLVIVLVVHRQAKGGGSSHQQDEDNGKNRGDPFRQCHKVAPKGSLFVS
jgi:hypothetical protein